MPLVYGKEVTRTCSETEARYVFSQVIYRIKTSLHVINKIFFYRNCLPWCFESSMIEQKVVLCDTNDIKSATREPGAFGYLIPNDGNNVSSVTPSPIAELSANNMKLVKAYKKSTK